MRLGGVGFQRNAKNGQSAMSQREPTQPKRNQDAKAKAEAGPKAPFGSRANASKDGSIMSTQQDTARSGDSAGHLDSQKAQLSVNGRQLDLDLVQGSEGEVAVDIGSLRSKSGLITLDPGYGNTGSCKSAITFIDGEKGVLRYRG